MHIQLLSNESKFLKELQYTKVIPQLLDQFQVDNVKFNVISYIDGISLANPALIKNKGEVIRALCRTVYVLHKNHKIIGDLTNNNFIFSNGICYLIDLEYVSDISEKRQREGYTPYYIPIDDEQKILSQKEDIFSLAVTILTILLENLPKYNSKNMDNAIKALESEIYASLQLKTENNAFFYLAYNLLELAKSNNLYYPDQLKAILKMKVCIPNFSPFTNKYQLDILNKKYQFLKVKNKNYDKYGLQQKWWQSNEFGEEVSPLSLQHGIVGVSGALDEKTIKNFKDLPNILKDNSKYMYSDSYLFGSSSLLWKLGYEYQNKKISSYEFEKAINNIIENWSNNEINNDFALGTAGKLYSLIFVLLLDKNLNIINEKAKVLYNELKKGIDKDHFSFSTTFDRINFAHGLSGTAYVLLLGALYFDDKDGIELAKYKLEFIDHVLVKKLLNNKNSTNYMYFSWCEGLSGIGSSLIRSQNLLKNSVDYKSLNKILSILQENGLKTDGSWCHGRCSIINFFSDIYLRRKNSKYSDIIKYLSLYEFSTAIELDDNVLNFIDETGYLHSLDFGVGQMGILKTILDALHKKDRIFFLTSEQEEYLGAKYMKSQIKK